MMDLVREWFEIRRVQPDTQAKVETRVLVGKVVIFSPRLYAYMEDWDMDTGLPLPDDWQHCLEQAGYEIVRVRQAGVGKGGA